MEGYGDIKLEPLSDSVFSYIFSDKDLTISMQELIDSVLLDAGDPLIGKVTSVQAQYGIRKRMVTTHGGRLDARVEAADGTLFDIEVQIYPEPAMNDRSWFYGSALMSEEFREGQPYNRVPRVRVINLLDFVLRDEHPDLLQPIGLLYRKEPETATDAFRIYNIELPKFRNTHPTLESVKDNPLLRWLYLLDAGYKNDHELEVLSNMTEGMKAFAKRYRISLNDPDLRRMYDYEMSAKREQASRDYNSKMMGIEIGRKEGRAEGMNHAWLSVVRRALAQGLPADVIYTLIDAPRAEIDALIAKVQSEN